MMSRVRETALPDLRELLGVTPRATWPKPYILHKAGWSIGNTAFEGKEGFTWLVYGTNGDHMIQANKGQSEERGRNIECRLSRVRVRRLLPG